MFLLCSNKHDDDSELTPNKENRGNLILPQTPIWTKQALLKVIFQHLLPLPDAVLLLDPILCSASHDKHAAESFTPLERQTQDRL